MNVQHVEHGSAALNWERQLRIGLAASEVEKAHTVRAILGWRRHSFSAFFFLLTSDGELDEDEGLTIGKDVMDLEVLNKWRDVSKQLSFDIYLK